MSQVFARGPEEGPLRVEGPVRGGGHCCYRAVGTRPVGYWNGGACIETGAVQIEARIFARLQVSLTGSWVLHSRQSRAGKPSIDRSLFNNYYSFSSL